jgi:hypothetical protein
MWVDPSYASTQAGGGVDCEFGQQDALNAQDISLYQNYMPYVDASLLQALKDDVMDVLTLAGSTSLPPSARTPQRARASPRSTNDRGHLSINISNNNCCYC